MTARLLISVIALAALAAGPAMPQDRDLEENISGKEDELQKLRRQIREQRKTISDIEEQEQDVSEYIAKLEKEEKLMKRLLSGLEDKESMLEEQAVQLRSDLETNEIVYRHRLDVFSGRLRKIYKNGPRHVWQELLAAEDFPDLLQRYKFLSLIAERDAGLITEVRKQKAGIEIQEAELTELLQEVTSSRSEKESELQRLDENEAKRRQTLVSLRSTRKQHQKRAAQLEEREKKMQDLIEALEKSRLSGSQDWGDYGEGDFASLKGRLPRPVGGEITRAFGRFRHAEYGTITFNTGIDISTRTGEPVRAVARGRVEYAGDLPGYGNCIILNHGSGYYTLYAHTSAVFVAQSAQVEKGSVIAEAGDAASGTGGTIHFEIRQAKKALDPAKWLAR
ncbi:MAG: peptidoglycan DD-metalloendopeptidase family protein [Candidatus Krumholzibacteria bacterium]|nr:peptidoglycan DD-metalloendopeptidase family protein [Candidatus Krumholzibacteria bacterium]